MGAAPGRMSPQEGESPARAGRRHGMTDATSVDNRDAQTRMKLALASSNMRRALEYSQPHLIAEYAHSAKKPRTEALPAVRRSYFLSYLLRNVNAVIAPELTRELGVSAAELGLLTSAYLLTSAPSSCLSVSCWTAMGQDASRRYCC